LKIDDSWQYALVPVTEINQRISKLQQRLAEQGLDGALVLDALHMYYYTGTMQQGVVVVPAQGEPLFLVRRSLERARFESPLKNIEPLTGFSRLQAVLKDQGVALNSLGLAETVLSVAVYNVLVKSLPQTRFIDISGLLSKVRSVKSAYEVACLRKAGEFHKQVYDAIPAMIREGMTEWELGSEIQQMMMHLGYTGITRFSVAGMELFMGVVSSGESGNYPTASIGPGGALGLSSAFPFVGGKKRIGRNEPIFIDTGFGYQGYFTDKTRIFSLGSLPKAALAAHASCLEIQEEVRCRLVPGAIPAKIYQEVTQSLVKERNFGQHFMGFGSNHVPFFGHGIGLTIDEFPVIAAKVREPLEANMVIALEPKKGLAGIGLVGIENTFLVTEQGGEKLTQGSDEVVIL